MKDPEGLKRKQKRREEAEKDALTRGTSGETGLRVSTSTWETRQLHMNETEAPNV